MRLLPLVVLFTAGGAARLSESTVVACTETYHPPYRKIDRRTDATTVTMTTTMAKTITLDTQPTEVPLLMQANDASKKPAAKGGAPVGNSSPAPATPSKNGAATVSVHSAALLLVPLTAMFM